MEQKAWIRKRSDVTAENQTGMKHSANRGIEIREKNGVTYLAFPALDATGLVSHAFSILYTMHSMHMQECVQS